MLNLTMGFTVRPPQSLAISWPYPSSIGSLAHTTHRLAQTALIFSPATKKSLKIAVSPNKQG